MIAVDTHLTASVGLAAVVLPAAGPGEVAGTTTNIEGRVLPLVQKVTPPGTARADWHIAAELAFRLGGDLGLESVDGIWEEIEQVAPSYAGITLDVLAIGAAREGVLMPLDPAQLGLVGASVTIASQRHGIDPGAAAAATHAAAADDRRGPPGGAGRGQGRAVRTASATRTPPTVPSTAGPPVRPGRPCWSSPPRSGRPSSRSSTPTGCAWWPHAPCTTRARWWPTPARWRASPTRPGCGSTRPTSPASACRTRPRSSVASPRGRLTLDAVADPSVPKGSAGIFVNHDGADPADLIDVTAPVTTVQIETLS